MEICSWHHEVIARIRAGERPIAGTPSWDLKDAGLVKCLEHEVGADGHKGRWIVTEAGNLIFKPRKTYRPKNNSGTI